jgi:cytochrome c553
MASGRSLAATAAALVVAVASVAVPAQAEDAARGAGLFATCAGCHGGDGAGNPELAAPAIAGLDRWYVEAQLVKFRSGVRGAHPDDAEGMRMRPMARFLETDADVAAVATYVAALPVVKPPPVLEGGDASRGRTLFAPCSACHGPDAAGNPQLNGPPLQHASDWYLLTQLKKFRAGMRGADPARDPTGAQMRPMSMTLADDQAMRDVIAYIMTLSN